MNRKIEERNRATPDAGKVGELRQEVARLDEECRKLADAIAQGAAYRSVAAALDAKEGRRAAAEAELAALAAPVPAAILPRVAPADVASRLTRLWDDIRKLDGDRARLALGQILDNIVVKPLRGS